MNSVKDNVSLQNDQKSDQGIYLGEGESFVSKTLQLEVTVNGVNLVLVSIGSVYS
jgi:multisubunit Na+/H+ antiporter MnhC subunit